MTNAFSREAAIEFYMDKLRSRLQGYGIDRKDRSEDELEMQEIQVYVYQGTRYEP